MSNLCHPAVNSQAPFVVLPMAHVTPPPMQGNDLFLNDMLKNVNIIPRSISLSIYLAIYIHIYNKNMYEGVLTYFICKIRMLSIF